MVNNVDVAIIGAGFGGLAAAKSAAELGAKVVVFESGEKYDGSCCAGGLPSFGLERMGIPPSDEYILNTINKIEIVMPTNKVVALELKHMKGVIIDKTRLTEILGELATQSGAEVRFNALVQKYNPETGMLHVTDDVCSYPVTAKVIIDASGCNTHLAVDAGLVPRMAKEDVCLCAQYLVEHGTIPATTMRMWVDQSESPGGYFWMFPQKAGVARVGVGVCDHKVNPKKILDEFIADLFPDCTKSNYIAATIPLAMPLAEIVHERVLFVGDRANAVFAISGAGNMTAFRTGQIAGEVAGRFIKEKCESTGYLTEYERLVKKELYKKLVNSYKFKKKLMDGGNKYVKRLYRLVRPFLGLHRIAPKWVEMKAMKNFRYS